VKDIIIKGGRQFVSARSRGTCRAPSMGIRKGCIVAFGLTDEATARKIDRVAETRERDAARRASLASAVTDLVSRGLGLPPDRVELIPPGSIPETSSGNCAAKKPGSLSCRNSFRLPARWRKSRAWNRKRLAQHQSETHAGAKRGLESCTGDCAVMFFALDRSVLGDRAIHQDRKKADAHLFRSQALVRARWGATCASSARSTWKRPGAKSTRRITQYFDVLPLMLGLGVPIASWRKWKSAGCPSFGHVLKRMGHLKFDRTDPDHDCARLDERKNPAQRRICFSVFPEGTFTSEDGVRPFQLGAFKAAVATARRSSPCLLPGLAGFCAMALIASAEQVSPSRCRRQSIHALRQTQVTPTILRVAQLIRLRDATRDAIVATPASRLL